MVLDLTLKDKAYFLKIHKNLFKSKSVPITFFRADNPLMEKYSYLGVFQADDQAFGFDGCFQKQGEDDHYLTYRFNFPEADNHIAIRRLLLTLYLTTDHVVDIMFYDKEFFSEKIWDDQALSFVIFNGGSATNSYAIGGQMYPWFTKRLNSLSDENLVNLNQYVFSELNRVSMHFYHREPPCSQITITRNSFFMQVNVDGRWLSWTQSQSVGRQEEFSSHNIDFYSDQALCFAAIIAVNTWLREN